jgi:hypothetical protein
VFFRRTKGKDMIITAGEQSLFRPTWEELARKAVRNG